MNVFRREVEPFRHDADDVQPAAVNLDPSDESARALFRRGIEGPVTMLNLLRFREWADYSGFPELAPPQPISGASLRIHSETPKTTASVAATERAATVGVDDARGDSNDSSAVAGGRCA